MICGHARTGVLAGPDRNAPQTGGDCCRTWPSSTVAPIRPNRLYLFDKKEVLASPQLFLISQSISLVCRNRHFCATFEGIAAPFWGIFVTNCQGQMRKEKFEGVATFLVRSGRS